ncbi:MULTISPECIES: 30S ribosomal protein S3 [Hymenobacter]|jgi:small subunit ribosomal protein S3|uniref:30S ribosomal protein S3 n=1 Tax=Hymenobacter TaxID=89966 RepID=UPI00156518AC|nr:MULTISPECIES: 30S ribosomal protein S3 [unclassified Hymenobacter]MDO7885080.1 30S ribosomal protein S3 [Hymenobacter sp. CA2-7]QKG57735.1 30S ribosomal protein S3 [Hymenobacter sp. BRD128]
MGQKVNPVGFRLGVIKGWDSNWYGGKDFADKLVEDEKIRKYINARIQKGGISRIVIERTLKRITITINTARPGVVIGKGGQEVDKIKDELKEITKKDVQINIFEIKRPELDARLVGESIAQQLAARISFRRAMKMSIQAAMRAGAEGIKIQCGGRLGGAEIARSEQYKEGRTPLHTLRADIDYALSEAQTVYGKIGIKVWVMRGEVFGKPDLSPNQVPAGQQGGDDRGGRGGDRGPRRDGDRNDRGPRRDGDRGPRRDGAAGGPRGGQGGGNRGGQGGGPAGGGNRGGQGGGPRR